MAAHNLSKWMLSLNQNEGKISGISMANGASPSPKKNFQSTSVYASILYLVTSEILGNAEEFLVLILPFPGGD